MTAPETHYPPLAQALGRLRQPRAWPYAPRAAETPPPDAALETALPPNDFLRMLPEPALSAELPVAKPTAPPAQERETLTAVEALALAPLNRTYWFDL